MDWLHNMVMWLLIHLDGVVYGLVSWAYDVIIEISETGLFRPNQMQTFANRVYVLLAIIMLFKISFSLVSYILNPDSLSDKSKGLGNLIVNFFVVIIGIVAVPYVFSAAYSLQTIIVKDNIIGNIVLGMNAEVMETGDYNYVAEGGRLMSYTTLTAFIRPREEIFGKECANQPVIASEYSNGQRTAIINPACEQYSDGSDNDAAKEALEMELNSGETVRESIINAYESADVNYYTTTDMINLKADDENGNSYYIMDYRFLISTLAGGLLAWILIMFCIDIATRSVKLSFLQLVAPVPIISYIDPKNGKDGIFKKWLKQCTSTYLDLFIRLLAIYFAIFIVTVIINGGLYNYADPTQSPGILITVLIILGTLMFAKQLPKLIEDIVGVKLSGGFTLSPIKKLQQVPIAGAVEAGVIGRGRAAITAVRHDQTGHRFRAALSGMSAAGEALHDKVPLMGAREGANTVRANQIGRDAGFRVATGNNYQRMAPFTGIARKKIENEIDNLKKTTRTPLQRELSQLQLEQENASKIYNQLNQQLDATTDSNKRIQIQNEMQKIRDRYKELSSRANKVQSDIGVVNDQIKDLERSYNIDKSTKSKLSKIQSGIESGEYFQTYGASLPPIDSFIPPTNGPKPSSTPSENIPPEGRTPNYKDNPKAGQGQMF